MGAAGALTALYHRDVTGEGQHVDVSMQEALSLTQETAMQTWDMMQALLARLAACAVDDAIGCVVITGALHAGGVNGVRVTDGAAMPLGVQPFFTSTQKSIG